MKKSIWKFGINPGSKPIIQMPKGAKILTVNTQDDFPVIWALCDVDVPTEPRKFAVYGTGGHLPDEPGEYVGTFFLSGGAFVYHVFEERP